MDKTKIMPRSFRCSVETAEKIKNKVLSVKDAMNEYNKKVAQNK